MLLNIDKNAKTIKGQKKGFMTGILYFKPNAKTCPNASIECMKFCLNGAGRGQMKNVQAGRKRKREYYYETPQLFLRELIRDISTLKRKAQNAGLIPVVRLNGTSDINWADLKWIKIDPSESNRFEGYNIFEMFSETQFYDYTKDFDKLKSNQVDNYHLTFSYSGTNNAECLEAMQRGYNVTQVFQNPPTGKFYINGDEHDLRFLDKAIPNGQFTGNIVALKAKGTKVENDFIMA